MQKMETKGCSKHFLSLFLQLWKISANTWFRLDFFNCFEISIKMTAHIDRLDEFLKVDGNKK